MKNKIEEAEEMLWIVRTDLKYAIKYKAEADNYKEMSNLQIWFIYNEYAQEDTVSIIKKHKMLFEVLDWKDTDLEAVFPDREIMVSLLKTIGQEVHVGELSNGKKEVLDIIDGKALFRKLKEYNIERPKSWIYSFKNELEVYCRNVHTIGNFVPVTQWDSNPLLKKMLNGKDSDVFRRFRGLKEGVLTPDELGDLTRYLRCANKLIECRSKKIINECAKALYALYLEYFDKCLSMFEHGKVFMQLSWDSKGYIWVAPEYEKTFDEYFDMIYLEKYFNEKPIDKMIGQRCWKGYIEYAYLALYDCCLDYDINDNVLSKHPYLLGLLADRAAYIVFRDHDLIKEAEDDDED